MTDSSGARGVVVVVIDDADPRDPAARCDRCGAQGTIARATRHTEPPIVTRYCGARWPEAQAALETDRADGREAFRRWVEASRRDPAGAPPRPPAPPAFSSASRSWHDTRRFLQRVRPDDAPASRWPDLSRAAKDIRSRAPQMEGPMPPDIAAFVDRFDPPAT
jgi:hypothetical protein